MQTDLRLRCKTNILSYNFTTAKNKSKWRRLVLPKAKIDIPATGITVWKIKSGSVAGLLRHQAEKKKDIDLMFCYLVGTAEMPTGKVVYHLSHLLCCSDSFTCLLVVFVWLLLVNGYESTGGRLIRDVIMILMKNSIHIIYIRGRVPVVVYNCTSCLSSVDIMWAGCSYSLSRRRLAYLNTDKRWTANKWAQE